MQMKFTIALSVMTKHYNKLFIIIHHNKRARKLVQRVKWIKMSGKGNVKNCHL